MSKSSKEAWDAAAKASAEREAAEASEAPKKRGRPKKGEQTRLTIDDRGVQHVKVTHELRRPMTDTDLLIASRTSARQHNRIKAIEEEIRAFANDSPGVDDDGKPRPSRKEEKNALKETSAKLDREIEAEAHLVMTPCIEVHDANRRMVIVYTDDNGEPGEEVIPERAMTDEEYERAVKGAPFAAPLEAPTGGQEEAP